MPLLYSLKRRTLVITKGILLPFTLKCMEQDPGSSRSQNMAILDSGRVGKMGLSCPRRIKPILSRRRRFCFGYIINPLLTHDGCLLAKFFYFAFFWTKNEVKVDKICKQNQTSMVNNTYNL